MQIGNSLKWGIFISRKSNCNLLLDSFYDHYTPDKTQDLQLLSGGEHKKDVGRHGQPGRGEKDHSGTTKVGGGII